MKRSWRMFGTRNAFARRRTETNLAALTAAMERIAPAGAKLALSLSAVAAAIGEVRRQARRFTMERGL